MYHVAVNDHGRLAYDADFTRGNGNLVSSSTGK
jgi:hypothetical protein